MALFVAQYTITATATNLTTIFGKKHYIKFLSIRNKTGATQPLYIGGSNVTNAPANAGDEIATSVAFKIEQGAAQGPVNTDEIYLVGTANAANIAFITIIE